MPIINIAGSSIDLVQVMAYNNWYDSLPGGSLQYLQDVTLQWLNKPSTFCVGCTVIANFSGVNASKLSIGVLASSSAGGPSYYNPPSVILSYTNWLKQQDILIAGMFLWDSHWDQLNNYAVSTAITTEGQQTPFTPG